METVVEVISACVEVHRPMGPRGSRSLAPGAPGALLVSPTPVELVRGGAVEGAMVLPGCSLDLHVLLAHGDRVEACRWAPSGLGSSNPAGPRVAIERLSQGHDVWRCVAAAVCGCRAGPATLYWRPPLKATPPQREASRGRGELPRLCPVQAAWALCVRPEGEGVEPTAGAMAWVARRRGMDRFAHTDAASLIADSILGE